MLEVEYTNQFKRDLKLSKKRNYDLDILMKTMGIIVEEKNLPTKLKDHALSGDWLGHRELHLKPDWLLIYKLVLAYQKVIFVRTGTHSDLFD